MIASIRQYLGLVSYRRLEQDATGGEIPEKTIFYPPGSSKYLSYLYLLFALVFSVAAAAAGYHFGALSSRNQCGIKQLEDVVDQGSQKIRRRLILSLIRLL